MSEDGVLSGFDLKLIAAALMSTLEWTKETGKYWTGIPIDIAIGAVSLATEASLYGVAMISVFYFFRGNVKAIAAMYIIASLVISWPSRALSKMQILLHLLSRTHMDHMHYLLLYALNLAKHIIPPPRRIRPEIDQGQMPDGSGPFGIRLWPCPG